MGEVVASRTARFAEGDIVTHQGGWREYATVGRGARKVDADGDLPESAFLGVLGMPGLTAYVGLLDIAALRDGDIVFVSGAAGAVGSLAGQIAKLRGHTVIGSAGSAEKLAWLRELGFDAVFDYHDGVREAAASTRRPTASTSTSTTSAASTSRPRSAACTTTAASRCAARSPATTRPSRSRGRATCSRRSASG